MPSSARFNVGSQRTPCWGLFPRVPADVCENCGEYYLSSEVTARVMEKAETAVHSGSEVEILAFAA
jgi:hypothetical protein